MVYPLPSPPTGAELAIYKGKVKQHQIQVDLEIDYPRVTAPLNETFADLDDWYQFEPDGTTITLTGTSVLLECDTGAAPYGVLRPAAIWSKEALIFPADKSIPWTLEWSMRFNYDLTDPLPVTKTYLATAFRVCGIDNTHDIGGSICSIDGNEYLGTRAEIPDGNPVGSALPITDTAFHTYQLVWDGSTYTLKRDGSTLGSVAGGIGGVIVRGADFVSIGVQGITNNTTAIWTPIEVQYVKIVSGSVTEAMVTPAWATSTHTSIFGDGKTFAYLPNYTVIGGKVSVDKENELDVGEITLKTEDPSSTNRNIFSNTRFSNRRIVISSRVSSDGGVTWSSMKNIFCGVIDEQEYGITDAEGITLTLRARDIYRRQMKRTLITKAYADFQNALVGIPNSKTVKYILNDLCVTAGLNAGSFSITADEGEGEAPILRPKALNFIQQDTLSAFKDICDDIVYEVWVDHKNQQGHIFARPYTYTSSATADYAFSIHDEVESISYTASDLSRVGHLDVTFENANQSPFIAGYPVSAWHGDDSQITRPSRIVQTAEDIAGVNVFHVDGWRKENRQVGGLTVEMHGQDWLEMNLNVTVLDDVFLNIGVGTIYMVDGWEYNFDGNSFKTTMKLVHRRPQDWYRSNL